MNGGADPDVHTMDTLNTSTLLTQTSSWIHTDTYLNIKLICWHVDDFVPVDCFQILFVRSGYLHHTAATHIGNYFIALYSGNNRYGIRLVNCKRSQSLLYMNIPIVVAFHREMIANRTVRTDPHQCFMDIDSAIDGKPGKNFLEG